MPRPMLLLSTQVTLAVLLLAACTTSPAPATAPPYTGGAYPCPGCRPTIVAVPMYQDVYINTGDLQVRGAYYTPDYLPAPGALLLHQNGGRKEDYGALIEALRTSGFAVLAIDMRGFGGTGGTSDWTKAPHDVALALDWLAKESHVNSDRIAVVGASVGANLALTAAAQDARVKAAVLLSPGLDYLGVKTETPAGQYQGPLMLVAAGGDLPAAQAVPRLAELHPGDENVVSLDGASHGTGMFASKPELVGQVVDWLGGQLHNR